MARLLQPLEGCARLVAQVSSPESLERLIDDGKAVFDYYASLPRRVAVRTLSDSRVRELRGSLTAADYRIYELREPALTQQLAKKDKAGKLLRKLLKVNLKKGPGEQIIDVDRLWAAVNEHNEATLRLLDQQAALADKVLSMMMTISTHVPGTSPREREKEESVVRMKLGELMLTRFAALDAAVGFTLLILGSSSPAHELDDPAWIEAMEVLATFPHDIHPAVNTAAPVVTTASRADEVTRAVLEDAIGRLQEFASGLEIAAARLHELGAGTDAENDPVRLLNKVVERVWVTADDVRRTLLAHAEPPGEAAPAARPQRASADTASGPPPVSAAIPVPGAGKGKGKGRARSGGAAKTASAAAPVAPTAAASSPAGRAPPRVLGRSALGTKLLVDGQQAVASTSASASGEPLVQRLARVLAFDLPAQQRQVSQARSQFSPENAVYVVEEAVKRLEAQAEEMQACLSELNNPQERRQLKSAQVVTVHQQTEQLGSLLAQVKGVARALREGMVADTIEHMKTYAFPTQAYVARLHDAGELVPAEAPRALKREPGTLFEIKLQLAPLRNGAVPRPMWLHLHTREAVHGPQLHELGDTDFAACHVKSDVERGRNRQWQDARAREGHENVMIHRGQLEPALCRTLMTSWVERHSGESGAGPIAAFD